MCSNVDRGNLSFYYCCCELCINQAFTLLPCENDASLTLSVPKTDLRSLLLNLCVVCKDCE